MSINIDINDILEEYDAMVSGLNKEIIKLRAYVKTLEKELREFHEAMNQVKEEKGE